MFEIMFYYDQYIKVRADILNISEGISPSLNLRSNDL